MSKITELASGQLTNSAAMTIILSEPDGMPASVIIHWPVMPTIVPRQIRIDVHRVPAVVMFRQKLSEVVQE